MTKEELQEELRALEEDIKKREDELKNDREQLHKNAEYNKITSLVNDKYNEITKKEKEIRNLRTQITKKYFTKSFYQKAYITNKGTNIRESILRFMKDKVKTSYLTRWEKEAFCNKLIEAGVQKNNEYKTKKEEYKQDKQKYDELLKEKAALNKHIQQKEKELQQVKNDYYWKQQKTKQLVNRSKNTKREEIVTKERERILTLDYNQLFKEYEELLPAYEL